MPASILLICAARTRNAQRNILKFRMICVRLTINVVCTYTLFAEKDFVRKNIVYIFFLLRVVVARACKYSRMLYLRLCGVSLYKYSKMVICTQHTTINMIYTTNFTYWCKQICIAPAQYGSQHCTFVESRCQVALRAFVCSQEYNIISAIYSCFPKKLFVQIYDIYLLCANQREYFSACTNRLPRINSTNWIF